MAIATKYQLLLTYDVYKEHNGFVVPMINDEDIRNGIDTPEKKFEAWSYRAQIQLNAVLQDGLAYEEYRLDQFKTNVQHDIINIMVSRLVRAFYNDEILPRDFGINYSQQGGVNYSMNGDIDPKSALYSFFNSDERLLIETSGLLEYVFSGADDEDDKQTLDNQFEDGPFVNQLKWADKANNIVVINGKNRSVQQALTELQNGKVTTTDLAKAISDATGLNTNANINKITVQLDKYLEYSNYRSNKGQNELAQVKDITDSEARSRQDVVNNQKSIKVNGDNVSDLTTRVEDLEAEENLDDKIWKGSETGTSIDANNKEFILDDLLDQDGNKFVFDSGKHLLISLVYDGSRYNSEVEIDSIVKDTLSIVKSGTTSIFELSINSITNPSDKVKLILTKKTGDINIDEISLGKILERKVGSIPELTKAQAKASFVSKSIKQNTDFSTFAELKNLVKDDDLVNLALASGENILGVITDNGTPLVITGYITDGVNTRHGNISIANDLSTKIVENSTGLKWVELTGDEITNFKDYSKKYVKLTYRLTGNGLDQVQTNILDLKLIQDRGVEKFIGLNLPQIHVSPNINIADGTGAIYVFKTNEYHSVDNYMVSDHGFTITINKVEVI